MKRSITVSALSLAIFAAGCDSAPTLGNFTDYISREVTAACAGGCRFVSMVKTDGQKDEMTNTYTMHASVTVEVLRPMSYISPGAMSGFIVTEDAGRIGGGRSANAGDRVSLPIRLIFEKFESGWKISPIQRSF